MSIMVTWIGYLEQVFISPNEQNFVELTNSRKDVKVWRICITKEGKSSNVIDLYMYKDTVIIQTQCQFKKLL
jgi:hypothetical protein